MEKGRLKGGGQFLRRSTDRPAAALSTLVEKVITNQKRVWGWKLSRGSKVVESVRTAHRSDRKGKAHKPNEFGRLVRIDEVENGIVSAYQF